MNNINVESAKVYIYMYIYIYICIYTYLCTHTYGYLLFLNLVDSENIVKTVLIPNCKENEDKIFC
jgi:hypothetical protein